MGFDSVIAPPAGLIWATCIIGGLAVVAIILWLIRFGATNRPDPLSVVGVTIRVALGPAAAIALFIIAELWSSDAEGHSWRSTSSIWLAVVAFLIALVLSLLIAIGALGAFARGHADAESAQPAPGATRSPGRAGLTRGQARYVMRHSTGFRMGNRKGRRPF